MNGVEKLQFEAQLLSGRDINNEEEALEAMKVLHDKGVKIVILSSTEFGSDDQLVCLASHMNNGQITKARIVFPGLPSHFVGTGDLFTGERLRDFRSECSDVSLLVLHYSFLQL